MNTTREDFLRRIDDIKLWRRGNDRAPHKPLLLLFALGRVQRGEKRLARYGNEVAEDLKKLLRRFGRPRSVLHAEAPFARLRGDDLWEVIADTDLDRIRGKGGISHRQLVDHAAAGGFKEADHELVALEAAHIRWHSHGGPDQVRNGLALCILHHQTFDRGAIGLERATKGYRLVVSDEANGQSPAFHQLLDCHGKRIRNPQSARQRPDPNFVDWHRKQVFRGTPRDLENP